MSQCGFRQFLGQQEIRNRVNEIEAITDYLRLEVAELTRDSEKLIEKEAMKI